ncbi:MULTISPECIES: antirestriction protein ArdA [Dyadobacter]|uniref:Antirestriction protein ArdA n=1 Tax=Dyadobacter psychrotolerans TaxID=2541721 RepID=A0A4R5DGS3_9BACT|nr:antirestriction protein ArdA [Dyadobacter psychrotolerans]TDE13206.1 antirestriction protein ArdA [Dyadobacter psychrotolerans]
MKTSVEFRIYVGTYAKYNDGSLFGKWMDLSDYIDLKDFYQACLELHQDEKDPELMFQDWEYIPDFLISESSLNEYTFEYLEEVTGMDEDRARALEIYCKDIASWPDKDKYFQELLEEFNDCYHGYYGGPMKDPQIEYAYQYVEDTGLLTDVSPTIERYFDYEAFAKDLFMDGYTQIEGHVFADY